MPARARTAWMRSSSAGSAAAHRASRTSRTGRRALVTPVATPIARTATYAAEDADVTLRLWQALKPRMVAEHVATVYETLERPLPRVLARMERRGISIDQPMLCAPVRRIRAEAGRARKGDQQDRRRRRSIPARPSSSATSCSARWACPAAPRPRPGSGRPARACWKNWPSRATNCREDPRLAAGHEAEIDLYRRAAGLRPSDRRSACTPPTRWRRPHRPAVLVRAEPAEHPDPHRGRPQDPHGLHRRAGQQARLCRLFADRAAAAGRSRRDAGVAQGLPRRHRHSRHDRVGNVRRAGRRTCRAKSAAAPRRSISASSTASRPSALPTSCRSPREEAGAYIKKYFERFPGIRDYMDETKEFCRENGYVLDAVRPQVPLSRHQGVEPLAPRLQRARRDQCAAAGLGRRHHPPRHDADGAGAGQGRALGADAAAGA